MDMRNLAITGCSICQQIHCCRECWEDIFLQSEKWLHEKSQPGKKGYNEKQKHAKNIEVIKA